MVGEAWLCQRVGSVGPVGPAVVPGVGRRRRLVTWSRKRMLWVAHCSALAVAWTMVTTTTTTMTTTTTTTTTAAAAVAGAAAGAAAGGVAMVLEE